MNFSLIMLLILKNINFIIPLIFLELLKQGMQKSLEDLELNRSGFSQIQFEKAKTQHKESTDNVGLIYVDQFYQENPMPLIYKMKEII